MTGFHKLFISKVFALLLSFLLFYGHSVWGNPRCEAGEPKTGKVKAAKNFDSALKEYNAGLYEQAKEKLEQILSLDKEGGPGLKAEVYLLLGACYEKSGKKFKARDCFMELKRMLDKGLIGQVPAVKGIDPGSLNEYQEVFGDKAFFKHKAPTSVSKIIKNNVVHAPRKSLEQKKREKKKKKFPWLLAVGGVIIVGAAAVLLLSKKKKKEEVEFPAIEWVRIPAGEFLMGDNFNEGEADELPVHQVYLDEYYTSKYEISIAQYYAFCDITGREKPFPLSPEHSFHAYIPTNYPIYSVTWQDAKDFCDWLSQKTGKNVNLPTEAQWEKAARGTYQYRYPWGNSPADETKAYYDQFLPTVEYAYVSSYPEGASPYGIHHMAGNVAEWCRDWYNSSYYSLSPGENPTGPAGGSSRVIRGGGFKEDAHGIRSANRASWLPGTKNSWIGFRIVKEN